MTGKVSQPRSTLRGVRKAATGVKGLDEIICGGLPARRATLVCGNAGARKTLHAVEFLVKGATLFDERGVVVKLEVVDIFQQPGRAGLDRVVAMRMLVGHLPLPMRRLIRTLSNTRQALHAFGVTVTKGNSATAHPQ